MNKGRLKRISLFIGGGIGLGVLLVVLLFLAVRFGIFGPLPDKDDLQQIKNATATVVYAADQKVIGKIFSENRTNTQLDSLPQNLLDALVATEDARFYEHDGVDKRSLLRVVVKSILLRDESAGGGSTLTQQLAKNLFGRKNYGILSLPVNKFKEIILAGRLEDLYTKEQILELYLNTVPFSDNTYGIDAASQRFFNKKPIELQAEESAVLIGMLKASTYYNPRINPENALRRRNVVLHQMERYGYLTQASYDSLKSLPLELEYTNLAELSPAAYFLKHVKDRATTFIEEKKKPNGESYNLESDGLKIYTTLNADMQHYARAAMHRHMKSLQNLFDRHWGNRKPWGSRTSVFDSELKKSISYKKLSQRFKNSDSLEYALNRKHPVLLYSSEGDTVMEMSVKDSVEYYIRLPNSGFLAMNPHDGAVLSWIGGLDYRYLPYDHVLAKRQAASTFKPIVYATALKMGQKPCDYIENKQRVYEAYENWAPANYDNKYGGFYSMKAALAYSVNVAAVQTIFKTGISNVINTARDLGVESDIPSHPSISLGTASISLYEMVRAYAGFANGGKRVEPYMIEKITTADGKVLYERKKTTFTRVLDEEVAALMNAMLQDVVNKGTASGLRSRFGISQNLAGKTGTAQNYTDGWFIGYNPHLVAGSWVGASSPAVHFRSGAYGSGSAMAMPIFARFFSDLSNNAELAYYGRASFPELTPRLQSQLNCEDFREENIFDKFLDIFQNEEGEEVEPEREKPREKQGFFKKIFGKKN